MTISIYWRPTSTKQHRIGGLSRDYDALRETLGLQLTESDLPTLRAMHRASGSQLYEGLIDAIEKAGSVEVFAEY